MGLIETLLDAYEKERYQQYIIDGVTNDIINKITSHYSQQYYGRNINYKGVEMRFRGCGIDKLRRLKETVVLSLAFFADYGKMRDYQREKALSAEKTFNKNGRLYQCEFKKDLWISLDYELTLQEALSGETKLDVKHTYL